MIKDIKHKDTEDGTKNLSVYADKGYSLRKITHYLQRPVSTTHSSPSFKYEFEKCLRIED